VGDIKKEDKNKVNIKEEVRNVISIKKISLRFFEFILGILILVILFKINNVKFQDIINSFSNIYLKSLLISFSISALSVFVRAIRWKLLIGPQSPIIFNLFLFTWARAFLEETVPARLGALSHIYFLSRRFKFPIEIGLSTMIVAMFFDFITITPLIILSILLVGINIPFLPVNIVLIVIVVTIILIIILLNLTKIINLGLTFYNWIVKKIGIGGKKFVKKIGEKLNLTNESIMKIRSQGVYIYVFLITLVIRVLKFTAYYFLLHSVVAFRGYAYKDLNFLKVFLSTSTAEFSALLPTHTFMGLGTYEVAFAYPLILLKVLDEKVATLAAFNFHTISLIYTIVLGLICLIIMMAPIYFRSKDEKDLKK
jgi:uncharacterized protein (TIRG00374 family)